MAILSRRNVFYQIVFCVFTLLTSIGMHRKVTMSCFWTSFFSWVFTKNMCFLKKIVFFLVFFSFFYVLATAQQADFDIFIFSKLKFTPSIGHLKSQYPSKIGVLDAFIRCNFINPQKLCFYWNSRDLRKMIQKCDKNHIFFIFIKILCILPANSLQQKRPCCQLNESTVCRDLQTASFWWKMPNQKKSVAKALLKWLRNSVVALPVLNRTFWESCQVRVNTAADPR